MFRRAHRPLTFQHTYHPWLNIHHLYGHEIIRKPDESLPGKQPFYILAMLIHLLFVCSTRCAFYQRIPIRGMGVLSMLSRVIHHLVMHVAARRDRTLKNFSWYVTRGKTIALSVPDKHMIYAVKRFPRPPKVQDICKTKGVLKTCWSRKTRLLRSLGFLLSLFFSLVVCNA